MASLTDKITDVRNAARPNSARVSSTRTAGASSLACDNLAGWPTASKVHFVTYKIDSNSNPVAGTQLDCQGIVSSNTITSFTVIDGSDVGHSVGDVVEMLPTAAWGQDLSDWGMAQHSRTGAHVGVNNTGGMTNVGGLSTDTLTVSSGTTLPAGDIGTADIATNSITAAKLSTSAIQLGYAQITSDSTTSSATPVVGSNQLAVAVTIPAGGRNVKVTVYAYGVYTNNAGGAPILWLYSGATVGTLTNNIQQALVPNTANGTDSRTMIYVSPTPPAAGTIAYTLALSNTGSDVTTLSAGAASPAFILVEAI